MDTASPCDYVARAVQCLGDSLTRRDTDPRGRMERLRRRVAARSEAAEEKIIDTVGIEPPRGIKRDAANQCEEERGSRRRPPRRGDEEARDAVPALAGPLASAAASSAEQHEHQGSHRAAPGAEHRADHHGADPRAHSPELDAAVGESEGQHWPLCGPASGEHGPAGDPASRSSHRHCSSEVNFLVSQDRSGGEGPWGIGGAQEPAAVGPHGGAKRGLPAGEHVAPPAARPRVDGGRASILGGSATGANALALPAPLPGRAVEAAAAADAHGRCRGDAARIGASCPATRAELIATLRRASPGYGAAAARGTGFATGAASSSSCGHGGQLALARGSDAAEGPMHDGPSDSAYGVKGAASAATRSSTSRAATASTTHASAVASSVWVRRGAQAGPAGGAAASPVIQGFPVPSSVSAVVVPQVEASVAIMGAAAPVRRRVTGKQRQAEATSRHPRATTPNARDTPSPAAQTERSPE